MKPDEKLCIRLSAIYQSCVAGARPPKVCMDEFVGLLSELADVTGSGLYWVFLDKYRRIQDVEEFEDIRQDTVQAITNWALETGEPFEVAADRFLRQYLIEMDELRQEGYPNLEFTREYSRKWLKRHKEIDEKFGN